MPGFTRNTQGFARIDSLQTKAGTNFTKPHDKPSSVGPAEIGVINLLGTPSNSLLSLLSLPSRSADRHDLLDDAHHQHRRLRRLLRPHRTLLPQRKR